MKVRIIQANGVKEFETVFNLDFLQQYIDKANISTTGDYVTTAGDASTTGGFYPNSGTTISSADNIKYTDYKFNTFVNNRLVKFYPST